MKDDKLFQIGEVAKLLGISRKMILDYEKAGLITPNYIEPSSGYRYFNIKDISILQLILDLRQAEMPIKKIKEYLNGNFNAEKQITEFKEKIKHIENVIEQIYIRNLTQDSTSSVKETILNEQYCICRDHIVNDIDSSINAFTNTYFECLSKKINLDKKNYHFCIFQKNILSNEMFDTENISMRVCIAVEKSEMKEKLVYYPQTKAVTITFCGDFKNITVAYEKLKQYIISHNLKPTGYLREMYIEGKVDNKLTKNIVYIAIPIMNNC